MADYIKRDFLLELAREYYSQGLKEEAVPVMAIKNIPSADVVEVKHARWIRGKHDVGMGITIPIIKCSLCGAITPVTEVERWKYCIGCGARMDGVSDAQVMPSKDGGT